MRQHLTDAGRLMVPRRGDPHGPLPPLLLALTLLTGVIDAFSFLALGRVLVANMTGNVIFSGFAVGGASGFLPWALFLAVAAFLAGAWLGGLMCRQLGAHRGRQVCAAVAVELGLVGAAWIVCLMVSPPYRQWSLAALIVLLGVAMGVQNATARAVAVPDLTTTVLTLTITGIAADSMTAKGSKLGRRLVPVLTMFAGAALGAALVSSGHDRAALALATGLLAVLVVPAVAAARSTEPWTRQA